MPAQLAFKAISDEVAADDVLEQVGKLTGLMNIARTKTDEGVEGFLIFENAELAAAAMNTEPAGKKLYSLEDPARPDAPKGKGAKGKGAAKRAKVGKGVECTGDFFNGPSPSTMKNDDHVTRRSARGGRGGDNNNNREGGRGGGRGRGGRGGNARGGRGGRGGRGDAPNRRPRVKAHVACVHNVPFNATNDQVFQCFKEAGHIFDIARSERIALVYFAEPDMVTNAIVAMNGKQIQGSNISVCNGGEMSIPVPPPPPGPPVGAPGAPPPGPLGAGGLPPGMMPPPGGDMGNAMPPPAGASAPL